MSMVDDAVPRLEEMAAALEALAEELDRYRDEGILLTPQAVCALVHALSESWTEARDLASNLRGEDAPPPGEGVVSLTEVRARRQIADWLRSQGLRAAWDTDGPQPGGHVA